MLFTINGVAMEEDDDDDDASVLIVWQRARNWITFYAPSVVDTNLCD